MLTIADLGEGSVKHYGRTDVIYGRFSDLAHRAQVLSTHWCNLVNIVRKLTIARHIFCWKQNAFLTCSRRFLKLEQL